MQGKLVMTVNERVNGVQHRADDVIGQVDGDGRYTFAGSHWDRGLVEPRLRDGRLRVTNARARSGAVESIPAKAEDGHDGALGDDGGGREVTVLPAEFPGVEALAAAEITTLEGLREFLTDGGELVAIKGIGKATAGQILAAIAPGSE